MSSGVFAVAAFVDVFEELSAFRLVAEVVEEQVRGFAEGLLVGEGLSDAVGDSLAAGLQIVFEGLAVSFQLGAKLFDLLPAFGGDVLLRARAAFVVARYAFEDFDLGAGRAE